MAARNGSRDASQWPRGALRRKTADSLVAVQSAPRLYSAELHLHFAGSDIKDALLTSWSSFPSDHAMLWMAVATGIFLVWRGIGVLAILYTVLFICVPRAYLGFHYPTDLLVGAAVGIGIT
jgi:undecaprenyl-diphosphatase